MMRYYSFNELVLDENGNIVDDKAITVSEEEIRRTYFPYWRQRKSKRTGEPCPDSDSEFEDCLDYWIVANWAWEVTE